MGRLERKRALITGGTSGIGLATAKRFVEEGALVAITGRKPADIAAARAELSTSVTVIEADAGNAAAQAQVAAEVHQTLGGLDVLFVNAGIIDMRPLEDWDEAGFDRLIDIDLKGPYFLIQALLPLFGNPASIILSGSVNARLGAPTTHVYSIAKAGMASLARTLSGELIGRGIRANVICPGPIATPLQFNRGGADAAAREAVAKATVAQVPAGRFGEPGEVANTVVFLASDEARFIVGSEIVIDGGMSVV
ncbi:MAG TPA: SDR family oxidoreductase [Devosiaceae bacterium]|nr:SDR family oxidoreductase [Devosiaceae bacterium]